MYKILCLSGKAGSGKDTVMQEMLEQEPELNEIISCTTRPMREGEINGKNYYFMKPDDFWNRIVSGDMIEWVNFNNWFYGTCIDQLKEDKINVGVFNPEGIEKLSKIDNIELLSFQLCVDDKERLVRQLNREKDPDVQEIIRRFTADEKDFNENYLIHLKIQNDGEASPAAVAHTILELTEDWRLEDNN